MEDSLLHIFMFVLNVVTLDRYHKVVTYLLTYHLPMIKLSTDYHRWNEIGMPKYSKVA